MTCWLDPRIVITRITSRLMILSFAFSLPNRFDVTHFWWSWPSVYYSYSHLCFLFHENSLWGIPAAIFTSAVLILSTNRSEEGVIDWITDEKRTLIRLHDRWINKEAGQQSGGEGEKAKQTLLFCLSTTSRCRNKATIIGWSSSAPVASANPRWCCASSRAPSESPTYRP